MKPPSLKMRWGPHSPLPRLGELMVSDGKPRGCYRITGMVDQGMRGGLGHGEPCRQFKLYVERLPLSALEGEGEVVHRFTWDSRTKGKPR